MEVIISLYLVLLERHLSAVPSFELFSIKHWQSGAEEGCKELGLFNP